MKNLDYHPLVTLCILPLLFSYCGGGTQSKEYVDDQPNTLQTVDIREWPVPWENSRPRDPYVAADGKVWFVGQLGNYVAFLNPDIEEFTRFELKKGTYPHNLLVDKDGFVWYAGNQDSHIGKLDPGDGSITQFDMPDEEARDPHTMVFNQQGNIWFTVQGGNFIGYRNTSSGEVRLVKVPTSGARTYGIKMDSKNRPWIVLFGTNKLATVDPATFELTEIVLPNTKSRPRRLEILSDESIYFVDYRRGFLGRYVPDTREFTEWPLPGGSNSRPYGTALDFNENIWIAESGLDPNRLVGFNTSTEEFFSITEIPSGGGTIRHMYFHPSTKEIWFGTDTGNIGRALIAL